jgi:hypothetical protein
MSRARDLGSSINSTAAGKNLLINGAFDIWQRGTSVTFLSGNVYLADRWCGGQRFQQSRQQRVSLGYQNTELNSQYAMRVSTSTVAESSGGTRMRLSQTVESLNTYQARGKQVTLSFWVRFSAATIPSVSNSGESLYGNWNAWITYYTTTTDAVQNTVGEDSDSGFININTGSLPTSWTKYTITGTVPNNANNIGVAMAFAGRGSTASADQHWYEVAQVQLEVGSSATPFSRSGGDIEGELAKCQRYFQSSFPIGTAPANNISPGMLFTMANNGNLINGMPFPVPMRTTPSFLTYNPYNTNSSWRRANGSTDIALTAVIANGNIGISYVGTSGFTVTGSDSIHGHWSASAEL